ncbi:molybdopterin molybdotransferase MoeA [Lysobacter sp. A3-1-A15]|uniref:molybdopterin molybdotransferase MoeA n=1 Tax=Novilysobacter viscosus TaxID=3098602 RepID=UPI002EDA78DF
MTTATYPTSISHAEALAVTANLAQAHRLEIEVQAIGRTHGRVLARDVVAPMPLPPFDNSAMDGFAYRHVDLAACRGGFRLSGEQFAGDAASAVLGPGECWRITTGAPLPGGADTVVIKERARLEGGQVHVPQDEPAGSHVRRAGEDVRRGDLVLTAGQWLTPARVSLAASLGLPSLPVSRRPTVAVFTSGDELVEPGMPLAPGQIHDSNRELLMGLLRSEGLEPTAWPRLPDDSRQVEIALRDAACAFDLVVTCGAVSAGERDHIPAVVAEFGEIHFWKVRMKPGMPVLLGSIDQARILALPGNPVSVLATWLTLGRALVDGLQGRTEARQSWSARLSAPIEKTHPRREFVRGRLMADGEGGLQVVPSGATGSHRLRAAADSNALIVVPEGAQSLQAGAVVDVLPYA